MHYRFKLAMVAAFILAAAVPLARGPTAAHAYPAADAVYVSEACNTDGTLQVSVGWTSYDTGQQWLDLAKGSTFESGNYNSYGPASPGTDSVSWRGFTQTADYAVRIVTATNDGWVASTPVSFTTRTCPIVVAHPVPVAVPVLIGFTPAGPTCPGCPPMLEPSDPAEAPTPPDGGTTGGSGTPSGTDGSNGTEGATDGSSTPPM
jgi:hypothetical protein